MRRGRVRDELRRQRDVQERGAAAGGGRGRAARADAGGDRRAVPDAGAAPGQAELPGETAYTIRFLAELKNLDLADLLRHVTATAERTFGPDVAHVRHAQTSRGHPAVSRSWPVALPATAGHGHGGHRGSPAGRVAWRRAAARGRGHPGLAGRLGVRPTKRLGQNFVVEQGTVRQIAALAAPGPATWSSRWAGPRLADAGAARGRPAAPGGGGGDRPGAGGRAARDDRGPGARVRRAGAPWSRPTRCAVGEGDLPAGADRCWPPTCPTTWPCRWCCTCWRRCLRWSAGSSWCRPRWRTGCARGPGSRVYGAPSAKLAWYAAARPAGTVPRSVFWPVPNVDSKLVAFTRHDPPATYGEPREEVFAVVDAAFGQRRKTLRAALAAGPGRRRRRSGCCARPGWTRRAGRVARRRRVRPPRPGARVSRAYDLVIVTSVTARVPAKINLQLAVGPLRADGYHGLVTVFHAVSLFDEVTVAAAGADRVTVTGEGAGPGARRRGQPGAARGRGAARRGPGRRGAAPGRVAVAISKRIPVAAGLAGGSADAAGRAGRLQRALAGRADPAGTVRGGARVGSDVAFAVLGGTAVGRGRGEQLTPALAPATGTTGCSRSPTASCPPPRSTRPWTGCAAGGGQGQGAEAGAPPSRERWMRR